MRPLHLVRAPHIIVIHTHSLTHLLTYSTHSFHSFPSSIMSQEYENSDDYRKVFVSRLPLKWKDAMLREHFEACFGPVEAASINWDKERDCSLGYGFVTFLNEEGSSKALEQGSMHVQRKIIQIRAVKREEDAEGRGRDSGVCFLWQKKRCVKGDNCKFLHEGEGACLVVADPYQGLARRKCLSFKTKGKCSRGDKCHFLHIAKEADGKAQKEESTIIEDAGTVAKVEDKERPKGVCHTFKKKGKCRKGDKCKFAHTISAPSSLEADEPTAGKRKRIDGSLLVQNRKKLLAEGGISTYVPSSSNYDNVDEQDTWIDDNEDA
jgi:RNA recognition motif-containing protein